ncbi:pyridoxamine 5'-phosphate oxidase [Microbacteriaceae bacterium VKM Ac-2854]|nr:pyridoxamine 5'-phosphate oxidase [Microbacteriaceae bacterium VKM Ac-2854]
MRDWLRSVPVFPPEVPDFDPDHGPADPLDLFTAWLEQAAEAGQLAPHAAVLSTADADGRVGARVLILKDADRRGWSFATHATSPKGHALAANPQAALTFFWPNVGRQVRVEGSIDRASRDESAADFSARPETSRAATLVGRQSEPLGSGAEYEAALAAAQQRLEQEPDAIDAAWSVYTLVPSRIEFWQAAHRRAHLRLEYRPRPNGWARTRLWP